MYSRTRGHREYWTEVCLLANRSNARPARINDDLLIRCSDEMTSVSEGTEFNSL